MAAMTTTVRGILDDTAYDVTLTGDRGNPVAGNTRVEALVRDAIASKRTVLLGPTGPRVTVAHDAPDAIVALLAEVGAVRHVGGPPAELTEHGKERVRRIL